MLIYLDQNYSSRIAKYLLGQEGHDHFGQLYERLCERDDIIPPSPFHVLELLDGYLRPPFETIYNRLSRGHWVKPWTQVLAAQKAGEPLVAETLLCTNGSWEEPADLGFFEDLLDLTMTGSRHERTHQASVTLCHRLGLPTAQGGALPFVQTFAQLLAFRSWNDERQHHDSDLADLVIAATIQPYADIFATDRFVREGLHRLGIGDTAYSGKRPDVLRLLDTLT